MPLPKHQYTAPAPRYMELLAGLVIGAFGLGILTLCAFGLIRQPLSSRVVWPVLIFAVVGGFCGLIAWRLLFNQARRKDQGLFGPTLLRFGGMIFLVGGAIGAKVYFPSGLLGLIGAVAAAMACFALARKRAGHRDRLPLDGSGE